MLLAGEMTLRWNGVEHRLGPRPNVFTAYPHAMYLPPGIAFEVTADALTELADCRARSAAGLKTRPPAAKGQLEPRLIRPEDCGYEIRGGGNASRQIIDIIRPEFPADRLMICEVLTPGGNWSSYPPHKHDVDDPPSEADLDEIYYFRFAHPDGYGFQRLYRPSRRRRGYDVTLRVEDGDVVAVRDGYHPFVTAYGYDAYYLNVLAGTRRSMAASDDPRHADLRRTWPAPDPRLPMVKRPNAECRVTLPSLPRHP